MKKHYLIGLTLGLLSLLLLFLVLKDRRAPSAELPARTDFLQQAIVPSEIATVRLWVEAQEGGNLSLVQEGEIWSVEAGGAKAPADPSWLDQLFESLEGLDAGGDIRGNSAAVHHTFIVGDDEGIHLELEDASGEVSHHLIVGKSNQDWSGTFLRRADEDTVYLVRSDLRQKLRTSGTQESAQIDPTSWWNLRLFPIDANDLIQLRVEGKIAVVRTIALQAPEEPEVKSPSSDTPQTESVQEPKWIVTSGAALGEPKQMARSFAVARATKAVPQNDATGLGASIEPQAILRAETNEGEHLVLEFGNESPDAEGSRFVRRAGETSIYVLPAYAVKNLLRAGEE